MASEDQSLDAVTQCPLCQTPMGSRDELQLHYLTSCSGYDKGMHAAELCYAAINGREIPGYSPNMCIMSTDTVAK